MKFVYESGYGRQLHWACERCIVRAMCTSFGCYMTKLRHCVCLDCDKNEKCKKKCERIERLILFDSVQHNYGPALKKHLEQQLKEQSLFYQLSKFGSQEFSWETLPNHF
jgi:hypothetical protein